MREGIAVDDEQGAVHGVGLDPGRTRAAIRCRADGADQLHSVGQLFLNEPAKHFEVLALRGKLARHSPPMCLYARFAWSGRTSSRLVPRRGVGRSHGRQQCAAQTCRHHFGNRLQAGRAEIVLSGTVAVSATDYRTRPMPGRAGSDLRRAAKATPAQVRARSRPGGSPSACSVGQAKQNGSREQGHRAIGGTPCSGRAINRTSSAKASSASSRWSVRSSRSTSRRSGKAWCSHAQ